MRFALTTLVICLVATALADDSMIALSNGAKTTKVASFSQYTKRRANALTIGSDGAFYAGGSGTVIKYDMRGKMLWKVIVGKAGDEITALAADSSGVYVACTQDYIGKNKLPLVAKIDSNGRLAWKVKLDRYRSADYIVSDNTGACYVSGNTKNGDLFAARLNGAAGAVLWQVTIKPPEISDEEAGEADADENFYALFALKKGRLVLTYPFQAKSRHTFFELDLASGKLLGRTTRVWNGEVNLPWRAKGPNGKEYEIRNTGRFAVG